MQLEFARIRSPKASCSSRHHELNHPDTVADFPRGKIDSSPTQETRHPSLPSFHRNRTKIYRTLRFHSEDPRLRPEEIAALAFAVPALAQQNSTPLYPASGNPADAQSQQEVSAQDNSQMPIFRVHVYERTARAVNYRHRGGSTTVDIHGTSLMPSITGKAKVDGKVGRLAIDVDLDHMQRPAGLGPQYLTYVLWAVTPEGRAVNLGEVLPGDNGKFKMNVTTDLQAFGLIVTAEPYFAVTHPSNEIVAENIIRPETKGFEESIDAKFDMLEGGQYTIDVATADQLPSAQARSRMCHSICSKPATP